MKIDTSILKSKKSNNFVDLVNCVFEAMVTAQMSHWEQKGPGSYARHMALGEFYDSIPDVIDTIVEAYQSKYGLISTDSMSVTKPKGDYLQYLKNKRSYVISERYNLIPESDSEIHNELDNLIMIFNKVIYKLENLS